ncbi:methylamine methyltransferase corrinoid protein reductive activase [Methanimicrococcus sp. OttesenSCG-928-J09]|nr:methylamine methyltransferase corrinoid protein reductive activase [Methanimicrococcus sp. OttesenSCG-928-J09]
MKTGVAVDLGTSGFRSQKVDLESGEIKRTVVTMRNPLPGANVMDHMDFAINYGLENAHKLVINAILVLIDRLGVAPEDLHRLSVCGNPIQLSLFQGIPIDDLAYAGERKREKLNIQEQKRESKYLKSDEVSGLEKFPNCTVIIPPAIKHEIGADALALIVNSGMLDSDEIAIATDFGTNAEMALKANGVIYTGSAAAGPALEGQEIKDGVLASPHAISDVEFEGSNIRCYVLDKEMKRMKGDLIDPTDGSVLEEGPIRAKGITGTGVIALMEEGMKSGLIKLPKIQTPDGIIHLQDGVEFTENDIKEAGNAIGALRAGHITLCHAAGIQMADIKISHMSGAAGTYMDAKKAQQIGMNPYNAEVLTQIGNTSLKTAREILLSDDRLKELQEIATQIVGTHVMFATDEAFKDAYILELGYWGEGMDFKMLKKFLKKKELPMLDDPIENPTVERLVERDIPVFGDEGYEMIKQTGTFLSVAMPDCAECAEKIRECPTHAMSYKDGAVKIRSDLCDGSNCKKCLRFMPQPYSWENLVVEDPVSGSTVEAETE